MKNVGVLIYTYNRVDDARVSMEIIRHIWEKEGLFEDVKIVHAYNGEDEWYFEKGDENSLVRIENSWHFQGASDLIDAGMEEFSVNYPDVEHIVVLASDTWLVDAGYIHNVIEKMKKENRRFATCSWGLPGREDFRDVGVAVDFFVIDASWARETTMFPIDYLSFYERNIEFMLYQRPGNIMLEKLVLARYFQAISKEKDIHATLRHDAKAGYLDLVERNPIHSHIDEQGEWHRNFYWPKMGLLTHHDPRDKQSILRDLNISAGEHTERLVNSSDLKYFNAGVKKMPFSSN